VGGRHDVPQRKAKLAMKLIGNLLRMVHGDGMDRTQHHCLAAELLELSHHCSVRHHHRAVMRWPLVGSSSNIAVCSSHGVHTRRRSNFSIGEFRKGDMVVDRFRREGEAGEDGRLKQGGVARLCLTMMSEVPDTKAGDAAARFTTDCNFMIQCKAPEASGPEGRFIGHRWLSCGQVGRVPH
jgi:hypothetical protein